MNLMTNTNTVIRQLSHTELEVTKILYEALNGQKSSVFVASDLIQGQEISRTVVTATISKLALVGIIRSKSLGMKGTHIEVLNQEALNEIAEV